MDFRISFKAGCNCSPGFIQLDRQLLYAFMSIGGMSQRPADEDPLSLPLFPLQQLLAEISPAIAIFQPDVPASQCILKALQQTKRVTGTLYPALRIVHQAFPGAGNNMFRSIIQEAFFRAV